VASMEAPVVSPAVFWYVILLMPLFRGILKRLRPARFPYRFIYSDAYWMIDLGNHVFPVEKYRLIYEELLHEGARKEHFLSPEPAAEEDLLLVHTPKYVKKLKTGKLSQSEIVTLELPYSVEFYDFARLMVGGTVAAVQKAVEDGLAVHLGGGFHHAFPDHGEGFCVLNDVAVAMKKALQEGFVSKGLVVDCDVHQGNGTAEALGGDERVFTFSLHQMDIYPAQKARSSLDVGLWSGNGDREYLEALRSSLAKIYDRFQPELVLYLAGADPYEKDQLGGLKVSQEGLRERDRMVIGEALRRRIPLAVLMAGGYAHDVKDTVRIHMNTIHTARRLMRKAARHRPRKA